VSETLAGWSLAQVEDDALLAAAELATNAVLHAGGDFTVGLSRREGAVRLMVGDRSDVPVHSDQLPFAGHGLPDGDTLGLRTGGRGLPIVATVADRWGCELTGVGKIVWADLGVPTDA
jgi:anti-sigma regulatory factor (Ser/Thr protein kinase)